MSEIAGRITRNIKAMHLDRVNWIAATLILNCERDIIRALTGRTDQVIGPRGVRRQQGGRRPYGPSDAFRKVQDKVRLYNDGHLPGRTKAEVAPDYAVATLSAEDARDALAETLASACNRIFDWHAAESDQPAPQIGIRATVGLGKSATSRSLELCMNLGDGI